MNTLTGKHIWIIGASSGIGKALAIELDQRGAVLALSARSQDKLEALRDELSGDQHIIAAADVSDYEGMKGAYERIKAQLKTLDSAIFMAAAYSPHDGKKKDINDIQRMLDVNIGGAFNMIDLVASDYERAGSGQIVLCASVAGYRGLPTGQPYCASKAALINLGESLRVEMQPKGVDVKIICPGFVRTPLTDKNDFDMPMMIEADEAAREIADGLLRSTFEIHFPKRFTIWMKLLKILPNPLYFWLAKFVMKKV